MKNVTIYHNPKCSTSRNILSALQKKGYRIQIIEYLKNPPKKKELMMILQLSDMKPSQIIRKKESLWTELCNSGKMTTENDILQQILENPILLERPILVTESFAAVARPQAEFILKIEQGLI